MTSAPARAGSAGSRLNEPPNTGYPPSATACRPVPLRQRGRSTLHIARLAFGGIVLGWTADKATSFALLGAFVAGGFSLIDPVADPFATMQAYQARLLAWPAFARAVADARPFRSCFPLGTPNRD